MKKFYIVSLIYSIFGSLGLMCFINWFSIIAFNESRHYPRLIPFCKTMGLICLMVCILNFYFNIKILLKIDISKKKVILKELLIVLVSFIPMVVMWSYFIGWLEIIF